MSVCVYLCLCMCVRVHIHAYIYIYISEYILPHIPTIVIFPTTFTHILPLLSPAETNMDSARSHNSDALPDGWFVFPFPPRTSHGWFFCSA